MRIAVLGTGVVGQALGGRLVEVGHEVMLGSRQAGNEKAVAWAQNVGERASEGSFKDAAAFGEIVINATGGEVSLDVLQAAGSDNLADKTLIDVSNPLAHGTGFPPELSVANTDSVGEQIQRAFPDARVVKTLNTVNYNVMIHPEVVPGRHVIFLSGEDEGAKKETRELLQSFGWPADRILDLGGIKSARYTEMYVPLWLALLQKFGTGLFSIAVERAEGQ